MVTILNVENVSEYTVFFLIISLPWKIVGVDSTSSLILGTYQ